VGILQPNLQSSHVHRHFTASFAADEQRNEQLTYAMTQELREMVTRDAALSLSLSMGEHRVGRARNLS
jgi:hypothetical protein